MDSSDSMTNNAISHQTSRAHSVGGGRGRGRGRGSQPALRCAGVGRGRGRGKSRAEVFGASGQFKKSFMDSDSALPLGSFQRQNRTPESSTVPIPRQGSMHDAQSKQSRCTATTEGHTLCLLQHQSPDKQVSASVIDKPTYQKAFKDLSACHNLTQLNSWCQKNTDILKDSMLQLSSNDIKQNDILYAALFIQLSHILHSILKKNLRQAERFEEYPNIYSELMQFFAYQAFYNIPSEKLLFISNLQIIPRFFKKSPNKSQFDSCYCHLSLIILKTLSSQNVQETLTFYESIINHFIYGLSGNYSIDDLQKDNILSEILPMITYVQEHKPNQLDQSRLDILHALSVLLTVSAIKISQPLADQIYMMIQQHTGALLVELKTKKKSLIRDYLSIQKLLDIITQSFNSRYNHDKNTHLLVKTSYELSKYIAQYSAHNTLRRITLLLLLKRYAQYKRINDKGLDQIIIPLYCTLSKTKLQGNIEIKIFEILTSFQYLRKHSSHVAYATHPETQQPCAVHVDELWMEILNYLISPSTELSVNHLKLISAEILDHIYAYHQDHTFTSKLSHLKAKVFRTSQKHLNNVLAQHQHKEAHYNTINIFLEVLETYMTIYPQSCAKNFESLDYQLVLESCQFLKRCDLLNHDHVSHLKVYRLQINCLDIVISQNLQLLNLTKQSDYASNINFTQHISSFLLDFVYELYNKIIQFHLESRIDQTVHSDDSVVAVVYLLLKIFQKYKLFSEIYPLTIPSKFLRIDRSTMSLSNSDNRKSMNTTIKERILESDLSISMIEEHSFELHGVQLTPVDFKLQYQKDKGPVCHVILEMQGLHHFHSSTDTTLITKNKYVRKRLLVREAVEEDVVQNATKGAITPSENPEHIYRFLEISQKTYSDFESNCEKKINKDSFLHLLMFASKSPCFYNKFTRSDILSKIQRRPPVLQ